MPGKRSIFLALVAVAAAVSVPGRAQAGDLKIILPRRSEPTTVQRLNREGVEAIRKGQYQKAEGTFYKAYLIDPDDPFTLNNLGYISELQGKIERAQRFYALATQQASDAVIERASARQLEGRGMRQAVTSLRDVPMQINRSNVAAMQLLSGGLPVEAELLLQKTLALDPQNAFTLNNLGVAKEAEGDLEAALKYYTEAENSYSSEPVIVTLDRTWRGKPVTEMADDNARKVRGRIQNAVTAESQAAMLTLRGVSAINRNDSHDASQDFLRAYSLDPNNAFSLNNLGYLAEMDGDLETAEFFYGKARKAQNVNARVGLATRRSVEGMRLFAVVNDSRQKVEAGIEEKSAVRRRQSGPVELKRRDHQPLDEPEQPVQPPLPHSSLPSPQSPDPQSPGSAPSASQPPISWPAQSNANF